MQRSLALAVLLAAVGLAAAGMVATDTYKCDPATCKPPTCMCASNSPPGGLTTEEMPQFILISHDNALDSLPYNIMQGVVGNKTQENGCNVPVTWFAMFYHSDCIAGQKALARGDEVAMQTNRFNPTDPFTATDPSPKYDSRDPVTGEPSVAIEITMSRKAWHEVCGIPLKDMVGFRAPNYYNNPAIRKALSEHGYLYDNTLIESWYPNSPTSPSGEAVLMPYTMDSGIPQDCGFMGPDVGKCERGENYAGLWEVPLWQAQPYGEPKGVGSYGDVEAGMPAVDDMYDFFKTQLDDKLAAGRMPMQISTHYGWMTDRVNVDPTCDNAGCERPPSENAKALGRFIDYALTKPEVRFVTYSDLVRWMQKPVPLDQFDDWVQCAVPGVKADLTAVNLTAADKADAFYLTNGATPVPMPGAPAPAPVAAPTTAPTPAAAPTPAPVQAPAPSPVSGAASLSSVVAAAVAVVGALLLAL